MKIITDEKFLKYRTALQIQRDTMIEDLAIFLTDLKERVAVRKQTNQPLVSKNDEGYINEKIFATIKIHFEIKFGSPLSAASLENMQAPIASIKKQLIQTAIEGEDPYTSILLITTALIDEEFRKIGYLKEV